MKKKSTSQSAPARRSPWLAVLSGRSFPGHAPASATGIAKAEVFTRRRLGEGGFFNLRVLIATVFCLAGIFFALTGAGLYLGSSKAQAQSGPASTMPVTANSPNAPDVVQLVGPVRLDQDLRSLPYIPPTPQILKERPTLHSFPLSGGPARSETSAFPRSQSVLEKIFRPVPTMPLPLLQFDGINAAQGNGVPPDTNGDVGPNHYVQSVNDSYRVFDKTAPL